jgi:hypothetical protein
VEKKELFRQRGYVLIAGFSILALIPIIFGINNASTLIEFGILFLIELVLILIIVLFNSFTVVLEDSAVRWHFALRFLEKELSYSQINSVKCVTNPFYWAFGIKVFSGGISYNVSGVKAVELQTKKGRKIRLGCDDPELLRKRIQQRISGSP